MHRTDKRIGWPTLAALGLVVVAFMGLSLLVTATGTARFAAAMGYDATVGYAVGGVFDMAKAILPVGVLALLAWRKLGIAALLGIAWIGLVTFSCLATHATVSTAISAIERTGTWKMEVRGNTKAELASVEQQLAALSRPTPPRPAKTVQEALAAERVPASVWHDSQECSRIQESAYFARACRQVVELRRELAAAQDYERLFSRAAELRKDLAQEPIVATADPLPAAFSTTLGRVLPLGGTEGVALVLTIVVEIMSSFGLVGVAALHGARAQQDRVGEPAKGSPTAGPREAVLREGDPRTSLHQPSLPQSPARTLPNPSLEAAPQALPEPSLKGIVACAQTLPGRSLGSSTKSLPQASLKGMETGEHDGEGGSKSPSNVVPLRPPSTGVSPKASRAAARPTKSTAAPISDVALFVQQRLRKVSGTSISHMELRAAYEAWCAERGHAPLSVPKFAAQLKALGCHNKWKSCGVVRYGDLQLVA